MKTLFDTIKQVSTSKKNKMKYLELGYSGENPSGIKKKVIVDSRNDNATEKKPISEFFSKNKEKFDIIFINHVKDYKQLVIDFNKSVKSLKKGGVIVINNLFPKEERLTEPRFCGDLYKVLNYFSKNDFDFITLQSEMGLTLVYGEDTIDEDVEDIKFEKFVELYPNGKKFTSDPQVWAEEFLSKV